MVGCQGEKNNAQKFRHKIDELLYNNHAQILDKCFDFNAIVLSRGSAAALSYCLPLHPSLATLAQLIESQLVNASRIAVDQQQSLPGYTLRENCREATSSCRTPPNAVG